jgi:tRNA-dihydrouridine synthase
MVASQEMMQDKPGMRARAELGLGCARTAVQLAGREARWMAEAARMVEGERRPTSSTSTWGAPPSG